MKRPEVTLENYQNLYQYYQQTEQSSKWLQCVHSILARIYNPKVEWDEDSREAISKRLAAGSRFIIASNHLVIADQFPIAAALRQEESLRPIIGNTFVPAKAPYYQQWYTKSLRPALDKLGAIPVFRSSEADKGRALQAEATRLFIATAAGKIIAGNHMFIFPEGTRNRENPTEIGRIHKGIGRIACTASAETPVSVLPMGLWYGDADSRQWLSPTLYIGEPFDGPFEYPTEVTEPLREKLSECVASAIEGHKSRNQNTDTSTKDLGV